MLLSYHVFAIVTAIGLVLLNDSIGLLWVLGLKRAFSERSLKLQHWLISAAYLAAVGTGFAVALSKPEVVRHTGFWVKMVFVALLGVNGFFMGKKCGPLAQQRFKTLAVRAKFSVSLSVIISLLLWLTTAFIGLFVMRSDF